MAKNNNKDTKKAPYNVFRKGLAGVIIGATLTTGLITGCSPSDLAGKDGKDGADGATWLTGVTTPTASQGKVGDLYFDTDDYILYQKSATAWEVLVQNFGKPGNTGNPGAPGDTVVFRVTETAIEWKYSKEADTEYATLVTLQTITGDSGDQVVFRVNEGNIEWKYSKQADTEYEQLVSLATLTGAPGKEVEFTADATHIKWKYTNEADSEYRNLVELSTLKGNQGKSAFEIAQNAGFEGTEVEWLESLKGVSIIDVEIEYEMDNRGNEVAVYTIKYSNDTEETVRVPLPARAEYVFIPDLYRTVTMCETGQEPTLKLYVSYENGTEGYVDITPDMFITEDYDEIDYQTPGEYWVKVMYRGKSVETTIKVVDPNDTTVESINASEYNWIMLFDEETGLVTNNYQGLFVQYRMANGKYDTIPMNDTNVSINLPEKEQITSGQEFTATISYENCDTDVNILPVTTTDLESLNKIEANYFGDTNLSCELNTVNPFDSDDLLRLVYEKEDDQYVLYSQIEPSMLSYNEQPFTSDTEYKSRMYNINVTGFNCYNNVEITVYDPATLRTVEDSTAYKTVKINTPADEIMVDIYCCTNTLNQVSLTVPFNKLTLNKQDVLTQVGRHIVTYSYKYSDTVTLQGRAIIEVYNPDVCNISNISIVGDNNLPAFYKGDNIEDYLTENFIGKRIRVYYYEPVNNQYYKEVTITREMLDISKFTATSLGRQQIGIKYTLDGQTDSYTEWETVYVMQDTSNAQVVGTYQANALAFMMSEDNTVIVYDNGIAEIGAMDPGQGFELSYQVEYDEDLFAEGIFKYADPNMGGDGYFAVVGQSTTDTTDDMIINYTPEGEEQEVFTLTWDMEGMPIPMTVNIFDVVNTTADPADEYVGNGSYYAEVYMDLTDMGMGVMQYSTCMVNIDKANNKLTAMDRTFTINLDKSLTLDAE